MRNRANEIGVGQFDPLQTRHVVISPSDCPGIRLERRQIRLKGRPSSQITLQIEQLTVDDSPANAGVYQLVDDVSHATHSVNSSGSSSDSCCVGVSTVDETSFFSGFKGVVSTSTVISFVKHPCGVSSAFRGRSVDPLAVSGAYLEADTAILEISSPRQGVCFRRPHAESMSNRDIAAHCGVSHPFVSSIRGGVATVSTFPPSVGRKSRNRTTSTRSTSTTPESDYSSDCVCGRFYGAGLRKKGEEAINKSRSRTMNATVRLKHAQRGD
jgi:hypothetical protein